MNWNEDQFGDHTTNDIVNTGLHAGPNYHPPPPPATNPFVLPCRRNKQNTHKHTPGRGLRVWPHFLAFYSELVFFDSWFLPSPQHNYTTSPASRPKAQSSVINKEDVAYLSMSLFVDLFRVYPANVGRYYTLCGKQFEWWPSFSSWWSIKPPLPWPGSKSIPPVRSFPSELRGRPRIQSHVCMRKSS